MSELNIVSLLPSDEDDHISISSDDNENIPEKSRVNIFNPSSDSFISTNPEGNKTARIKRFNKDSYGYIVGFKKRKVTKKKSINKENGNSRPMIINRSPNYWKECSELISLEEDKQGIYINRFNSASLSDFGLATRVILPCLPPTTTTSSNKTISGSYIPASTPTLLTKREVEKIVLFNKLIFSIVNPKLEREKITINSPYFFVPLTNDGELNWLHINNIGGIKLTNCCDELDGKIIINSYNSVAIIISNKSDGLLKGVHYISETQAKEQSWVDSLIYHISFNLLLSAEAFSNFMSSLDSLLLAKELADKLDIKNIDLNKLTQVLNLKKNDFDSWEVSKFHKLGVSYAHLMIGLETFDEFPFATPGFLAKEVDLLNSADRYIKLAKKFGLNKYISLFTGNYNDLSYIMKCIIGFICSDLNETMGVKVVSAFKICFSDYSVWESVINKYRIHHGSHETYHIVGYKFKSYKLLDEAITVGPSRTLTPNYQRMEYLGDLVIDFFTSILVYKKYPLLHVKSLREIIVFLVRNITLALILQTTDLEKFMPMEFDNSIIPCEDKVVADIFEAVCTAVWLDCCLDFKECFVVLNNLTTKGFTLMLEKLIDEGSDKVNTKYCLGVLDKLGYNEVYLKWSHRSGVTKVEAVYEQGKIIVNGKGSNRDCALWDMLLRLNKLYVDKKL